MNNYPSDSGILRHDVEETEQEDKLSAFLKYLFKTAFS